MSKSHARRKKVPPQPVSRIGQHGKRPMAKPLKEKRAIKISKNSFSLVLLAAKEFIRKYFLILLVVLILSSFTFVAFFTSIFSLSSYRIIHDEKSGCLTREYIDIYVRLHITKVWSHIFYSDQELRTIHPCLENLHLQWNPFRPKVVTVIVTARKPVLRVMTQRVNVIDAVATAARIFQEPVASEETRFMLPDGRLVLLDATPDIPEVWLRYTNSTQLESTTFSQDEVITILQLQNYLQKEYRSISITLTTTGVVHFSLDQIPNVYTTLRQDLPSQLASLQAILGASTIDKSKLFSIDVRSGNAVVRYKE